MNDASIEKYLITGFVKDVMSESQRGCDIEQNGRIARRFDDVIFGISISLVLFLIASVIAIALYTVT